MSAFDRQKKRVIRHGLVMKDDLSFRAGRQVEELFVTSVFARKRGSNYVANYWESRALRLLKAIRKSRFGMNPRDL